MNWTCDAGLTAEAALGIEFDGSLWGVTQRHLIQTLNSFRIQRGQQKKLQTNTDKGQKYI